MNVNLALLVMIVVAALGCNDKGVKAPAPSAASPSLATAASPGDAWRAMLRPGAKLEEVLTEDLDGDGVPEVVALSSKVDPDLAETEGVTKEQLRMNLELWVQVFAAPAGRVVELGRVEMLGGRQLFRVGHLEGGGRRKFVIASALHCGASCAGIELHVLGVRSGRFERLMDRDSVDKGDVKITPGGVLELRETAYSGGEERAPVGVNVSTFSMSGDSLVRVSERTESFGKKASTRH